MLSAARGKVWMSEGVFRNTADISAKFPERYNRQKIFIFYNGEFDPGSG